MSGLSCHAWTYLRDCCGLLREQNGERVGNKTHAGTLGGAVAQDSSQSTVGGCLFTGNKAQNQGGALYQSNTTGDVTTCTFANNSAANGGAIYQNLANGTVGFPA